MEQVRLLFKRASLPELVGVFFSCPPPAPLLSLSEQDPQQELEDGDMEVECGAHTVYCYCQGPDEGEIAHVTTHIALHLPVVSLSMLTLDTPRTSGTAQTAANSG